MNYKPQHTLITLIAIASLLGVGFLLFPHNGISISENITLIFPSINIFNSTEDASDGIIDEDISMEDTLEIATVEIDSLMLNDLFAVEQIKIIKERQNVLKIQYSDSNLFVLSKFFEALDKVDRFPVRILHYGDSQIEGDRMSGYLRNEFQKQFGGTGCGLIPIFETFPTFAIKQSDSGNWKRYAAFFSKNKKPTHQRFGLMANYSRFTPAVADSLLDVQESTNAWVRFTPNKRTYHRAGKFNKVRMLYGYNRKPFVTRVFVDDKLVFFDTLDASFSSQTVIWSLADFPADMKIEFDGVDSPDIYGISLETPAGVHLDNIGMRGSSGTFFTKLDRAVLKKQSVELEPNLILLQYGGNTVPSIHSKKKAKEYGNWFESQIRLLKRLNPYASIIIIGPSDMSVEVDGKLQTRKYLEEVRDALKEAAFNTDSGFWDLYEVMGGRNSMISWVEADPPLAANDYTHFAPGGAKKLSKLFYTALMDDYKLWKKNLP